EYRGPHKTREILRSPANSLGGLRNLRKIAQFRQNRSTLPLTASTLVDPRSWRLAGTLHHLTTARTAFLELNKHTRSLNQGFQEAPRAISCSSVHQQVRRRRRLFAVLR